MFPDCFTVPRLLHCQPRWRVPALLWLSRLARRRWWTSPKSSHNLLSSAHPRACQSGSLPAASRAARIPRGFSCARQPSRTQARNPLWQQHLRSLLTRASCGSSSDEPAVPSLPSPSPPTQTWLPNGVRRPGHSARRGRCFNMPWPRSGRWACHGVAPANMPPRWAAGNRAARVHMHALWVLLPRCGRTWSSFLAPSLAAHTVGNRHGDAAPLEGGSGIVAVSF